MISAPESIATLSLILLVSLACRSAVAQSYEEEMQAALLLRHEGNSEAAGKIYSKIIAANPGDVDARVGRGFCLIQNEKVFADAEKDFEVVIKLAPSYIDAYYGLALIYKRRGRWREAMQILEIAEEHCADEDGRKYLADICWQIGHLSLARSVTTGSNSETTERVKGYSNEVYLNYTYDWVEDRPDWYQASAVYVRHLRPDLNVGASFSTYRRSGEYDEQLGLSLGYRHNIYWSFEYQGFYSADNDFLARQKHHPMFHCSFPSSTVVGAGLKWDEYEDGWATSGRFDVRQYVRSFYVEYSVLAGRDNFDRSVTTHIAKVGYESDNRLFAHLGYSSGDETSGEVGGSVFSDQRVESLFVNLRYFFSPKCGIIVAGGPEYRDSELFRTTGAISGFSRF